MPQWLKDMHPLAAFGAIGILVLGALDHAHQGWPANWSDSDWTMVGAGFFVLTGTALAIGAANLMNNSTTTTPPTAPPVTPTPPAPVQAPGTAPGIAQP